MLLDISKHLVGSVRSKVFNCCSCDPLDGRGADPQAPDKEGKTPLQLVKESDLDDVEIIAVLKNASR